MTLKKIAVYCGSNLGNQTQYAKDATQMGHVLAEANIELIYGGGKIGLMGLIADAVLEAGGQVTGVIPTFLKDKEMAHTGLTTLIETPDMTTRKQTMMDLADGFIALPGGLGTFEEILEAFSAAQLRLHAKPVGFLDSCQFYAPFRALLQQAIHNQFMPISNLSLCHFNDKPSALLAAMQSHTPIYTPKHTQPLEGI